jgi:peptidoglycan/xylan/chitin deacetylase (PgdA/CDA1 family)
LPATVFVVAGNLGRKPGWPIPNGNPERDEVLSSVEQLRGYPADLIEIGSHTMSHPNLKELSPGDVRREMVESKRMLEARLARPVTSFSVPFGECHAATLAMAGEAGYRAAMTCEPQPVRPGDSLIGAGRFKVTPDDWMLEFRLAAVGAYRWRRLWRRLRGETGMSAPERRS